MRVRVLLVAPEATERLLLTNMLTRGGMVPLPVASTPESMAVLDRDRPGLVLADAAVPDLESLVAAARARALPTVLMAADGHAIDRGCVRLSNPVRQADLAATIARALEPRRDLRVLLVDDDAVSREMAAHHLRRLGHVVVLARSAAEAWACWRSEGIDLVLMDVLMPGMGGLELTEHIRAHERETGARLPIVALTGRADAVDRERCLAAGMDGHLEKPIDLDALARTIDDLAGVGIPRRAPAVAAPRETGPVDAGLLLERVHGDMSLLRRLIAIFREQSADLLRDGWRAIERGDPRGLDDAAHALRSVVGHFSTGAAFELAGVVEAMARTADVAAASARWCELESMVARLRLALDEFDPPEAAAGQGTS